MSAQADAALSFDRAGFTYAGAREPALADVSLSVPAGQCVVLTGGSGCGKTTLTRLANGLIPVSYDGELAGSVRIAGKDAGSWEMDALCRRVGSVFQNPRSQFFNLDTTSEVAFGCENLGLSRAEMHRRVDGAFALLGIEHLRDRDIRALSGGQRQMVAIAPTSSCWTSPRRRSTWAPCSSWPRRSRGSRPRARPCSWPSTGCGGSRASPTGWW